MLNGCHSGYSEGTRCRWLGVAILMATTAVLAWFTYSRAYHQTHHFWPISWDSYVNKSSSPRFTTGFTELFSEKNGGNLKLLVLSRLPAYRQPLEDRVMNCGSYSCLLTSNRSRMSEADGIIVDAFLISGKDPKPIRSSRNQVWVFFTKEPWLNYKHRIRLRHWDGIFNWTVTYQTNSDIVIPYNKLRKKQTTSEASDWDDVLKRKTRSVLWFVSNCHSGSRREVYVRELRKHIDIDVVGKCGNSTCDGDVDKADVCYPKYRFYLAFENTLCRDYLTEKFFRTFSHHIIPIVRGYGNYNRLPRRDLFINTADFRSPLDLAIYLRYLENNSTAYIALLKAHAQYVARSGGNGQCDVCRRLHQLDTYRRSYSSISAFMECVRPVNPHLQ